MAVRIYSLAKELNVDSKELVDICTRAGVPGKGSALASLTDDEVAKVKQFMSGPSDAPVAKGAKGKAAPPPPVRPTEARGADRMKVIVTPKTGGPRLSPRRGSEEEEQPTEAETPPPAEAAPGEAAQAESTPSEAVASEAPAGGVPAGEVAEEQGAAVASQAAEAASAAETAAEVHREKLAKPGPLARMVRKEDYIGPANSGSGKMPVVGAGGDQRKGGARKSPEAKARPAVRLAAVPAKAQPKKPEKPKEEAKAQKPVMTLPTEVLGANKLGSKPLAQHLRRAERTLEAEQIRERTGGARAKETEDDDSRRKASGRPMLGGREARQLNRDRGNRRQRPGFGRRVRRTRRSGVNTAAPRKGRIEIQLPCTVRDLSEAAGVPARDIQRILMEEGVMATINTPMDPELTEFVAAELGMDVDFLQPETLEDKVLRRLDEIEDDEKDLQDRPPVITFLGHVDHGKTSLLDKLIGIDVASGESGGITQHIRAYQIEKGDKKISFVDTPGHEAFTAMRARGANVTDIAVIVVAADDGVMPQTEEAISHARAADVPIVVALNKMDLPGADPMKAMTGLSQNGLQPSEWGGDVEVVKTSAATGEGLDELLDTILTVAELHEYKANPNRSAIGVCLEATQDADQGVQAKMIVETGTLRIGDIVVCGDAYGRVRSMSNTLDKHQKMDEAGPTATVNLTGFDVAPPAGERFYVLDDVAQAREIAEARAHQTRSEFLGQTGYQHVTLETLFDRLDGVEEVQTLNLIIRADVRGSIEAIQKELAKLEHPEVRLRVLQASVGGVTAADIHLADASDAIIIAFNVVPEESARSLAEQSGVQVRRYDIIYKITDELRAAMEGMLRPEKMEVSLGRALIQQVFRISRIGSVAGCRVIQGVVERNARARVIRDSTIIGDYPIDALKREKDDAKEVREGYECGIKLSGFNDIKEADLLEVYKVEEIARSFDD
ncbi:Translation initiation factor IF-2 [Posidoniimonas polymericola]|uniref:Translation initiation factor IF-2 n=1 Tax=Posidoniimonas polymericola TaxID=2528002 RepID=A0A5C5YEU2_9BACT|nr:Translation initiation factor IF-2 [Posidoniimonas polymericola]